MGLKSKQKVISLMLMVCTEPGGNLTQISFLVFSNFTEFTQGVNKKARQVKALAMYTDNLNSIPRTHMVGGGTDSCKLSFTLHKSTITFEILDFQIRDAQNIEQKEKRSCRLSVAQGESSTSFLFM